jgi:hypothetical protein
MSAPQRKKDGLETNKMIDVFKSAVELATIFVENPAFAEKTLVTEGQGHIGIFQDPTFKEDTPNFRELKFEALKMAIEDLAMGAMTLRGSSIGITHDRGVVKSFICPIGVPPPGNSMYTINLKNAVAFKNFRFDKGEEFPQDIINASIYYLTYVLAQTFPEKFK